MSTKEEIIQAAVERVEVKSACRYTLHAMFSIPVADGNIRRPSAQTTACLPTPLGCNHLSVAMQAGRSVLCGMNLCSSDSNQPILARHHLAAQECFLRAVRSGKCRTQKGRVNLGQSSGTEGTGKSLN